MRCVLGVRLGAVLAWGWACGVMWAARGGKAAGAQVQSEEGARHGQGGSGEGHALTYDGTSGRVSSACGCTALLQA